MLSRHELQAELVDRIVEGMSIQELVSLAQDSLHAQYDEMEDAEFGDMVNEFFPDLLEN